MKRVHVGRSKIAGLGVIAGEDIKKGDLITLVRGPIRHFRVATKKDAQKYAVWIGRSKYTWFDPKPPLNRINHSCNPSAGIRGRVRMYALRDINKGDEVTVDYSTIEPQSLWNMQCTCGSKKCRKVVRSIQFLPQAVYKKYLPYVPTSFQHLYERNTKKTHEK